MKEKIGFLKIGFILAGISLILYFLPEQVNGGNREKNVAAFNQEFECSMELIYGEWEVAEYLGGGMPGFSAGDNIGILEEKKEKDFPYIRIM